MYTAVPLFKSHYSLGKSVLTLAPPGNAAEDEPSSVFDISAKLKLKNITLVEDSMSGFLEAYKSSEQLGAQLSFGLRLTVCEDISKKTADSRIKEHKIIVFAKNGSGYYDLIKISTIACNDGFYYYGIVEKDISAFTMGLGHTRENKLEISLEEIIKRRCEELREITYPHPL